MTEDSGGQSNLPLLFVHNEISHRSGILVFEKELYWIIWVLHRQEHPVQGRIGQGACLSSECHTKLASLNMGNSIPGYQTRSLNTNCASHRFQIL